MMGKLPTRCRPIFFATKNIFMMHDACNGVHNNFSDLISDELFSSIN